MLLTHRQDTRVGTVTILKDNCGEYCAVLQLSSDTPFFDPLPKTGSSIGIDLNLTNLYTDSSGNVVENPKTGQKAARKLAKEQRRLSRMEQRAKKEDRPLQTSSNYQKQRIKTARLQRRAARSREDYLQVQTKRLVENQDRIVSEDLRVKDLLKNQRLAYSIADVSWGRFRELLAQKAEMYGKEYLAVPAAYTTQTCSCCGHILSGKERIPLGGEEWTCPECGAHHCRDHNAAVNILARGLAGL